MPTSISINKKIRKKCGRWSSFRFQKAIDPKIFLTSPSCPLLHSKIYSTAHIFFSFFPMKIIIRNYAVLTAV